MFVFVRFPLEFAGHDSGDMTEGRTRRHGQMVGRRPAVKGKAQGTLVLAGLVASCLDVSGHEGSAEMSTGLREGEESRVREVLRSICQKLGILGRTIHRLFENKIELMCHGRLE